MKTSQIVIKKQDMGSASLAEIAKSNAQFGLMFAPVEAFEDSQFIKKLKAETPGVQWVGCSTAGEVSQRGVSDGTTILTAIHFDNPKSKFRITSCKINNADDSLNAGKRLASELKSDDLKAVMVIAPGVNVNGSLLVQGVSEVLGKNIAITGGLAGDGGKFSNTFTISPNGVANDQVIGVGFYGDGIALQHGCMGGWDAFGKVRKVTKSKLNVVYELDGKPALDIYKEYLGDHAKDLPASGLMFPFSILKPGEDKVGLIRTILAVSEKDGSLTFAGNIEEGATVRLMHANTGGLVQGAKAAAANAIKKGQGKSSLALVVSCVGRKLVMGANVDEEIEGVLELLGKNCALTGFYSYGEISPHLDGVGCELHNQTMTISYIYEN